MTITNTLKRSSCSKCVEVLQELVSGLQQQDDGNNNNNNNGNKKRNVESSPLSLLKAIARSSHQQRNDYDRYGQHKIPQRSRRHHQQQRQFQVQQNPPNSLVKIEEVEDGVRLTIPVETTEPTTMKQWTRLRQPYENQNEDYDHDNGEALIRDDSNVNVPALATSVRINANRVTSNATTATDLYDDDSTTTQQRAIHNPLTIELYCRKCSTKGPEAGARAFLMGPEPLSIVLCHNRINSDRDEIEEILTHELIHLYDVQTLQLDLTDCETVAYSEIRAAREAECSRYSPYNNTNIRGGGGDRRRTRNRNTNENDNDNHQDQTSSSSLMQHVPKIISERWTKAQQSYCIQNIALGAVQNMFPQRGKGKRCLNQVWTKAYNDHRQFHNGRFFHHHTDQSRNQNYSSKSAPLSEQQQQRKCSGTIHGTSGK